MLIASPEDNELFGHAFRIIIDNPSGENAPPSHTAENTYFSATLSSGKFKDEREMMKSPLKRSGFFDLSRGLIC